MSRYSVAHLFTIASFSLCLFLSSVSSSPRHSISCDTDISCTIDTCSTTHSCKDHDIYCTENYNCTVICDTEQACYGANIFCPRNADCIINCGMSSILNDTQICRQLSIHAYESSTLTINLGSNLVMRESYIECPNNGMYTSSAVVPCQILFYNGAITPLINSTIIAVEGLHDINIDCGSSDCCCLYGDEILACTADGSSSCVLNSTTTCDPTTIIGVNCATYVLPSDSPIPQPTYLPNPTLIPTITPTIEPTMVPTFEPTVEPSSSPTLG